MSSFFPTGSKFKLPSGDKSCQPSKKVRIKIIKNSIKDGYDYFSQVLKWVLNVLFQGAATHRTGILKFRLMAAANGEVSASLQGSNYL